jgi:hypothetical protein
MPGLNVSGPQLVVKAVVTTCFARSVIFFLLLGRFNLRFECAVWMCVHRLMRFRHHFEFLTLKMTWKTHSTVKATSKLYLQNASAIDLC